MKDKVQQEQTAYTGYTTARRTTGFTRQKEIAQMESKSPPLPLLPPVSRFCVRLGSNYHAIVNAVCAVGSAEPGIPTQVVGRALDGGSYATGRERRNHLSYRISGRSRRAATGGCAGVVSGVVSIG